MAIKNNPESSGINNEDLDSGRNITGANMDPAAALWRGAQRSTNWMPPEFLQTYGNYTGLFPSMGQQVGQALWGSVQAQNYQPAWMQTRLPSRQNNTVSMNKYSPFQAGGRTMGNPYPLNGTVNLTTPNIGYVNKAGNPFIGMYQGLGGMPGGGLSGGDGLTPTSWTGQLPPPPPPNTNPPPGLVPTGGGTAPAGGGLPPSGGTQGPNPYERPPVYSQPPPAQQQYPDGRPVSGTPATYVGGPTRPPFIEPAPGSGGPTGGPSMGGMPYTGSPTAGPGGPIGPDNTVGQMRPTAGKQMQISPAMIQGLLSYFRGM